MNEYHSSHEPTRTVPETDTHLGALVHKMFPCNTFRLTTNVFCTCPKCTVVFEQNWPQALEEFPFAGVVECLIS